MPKRKFVGLVGDIPDRLTKVFKFIDPVSYPQTDGILQQAGLVISHSYISPRVNYFIIKAKQLGITTLYLVDGPLEWSNSYLNARLFARNRFFDGALMEPLLHDIVLAVSPAQAAYLQYRNAGREIRFFAYNNKRITDMSLSSNNDKTEARWQFLITTAKYPYFNQVESHNLVQMLRRLVESLQRCGYSYVFRLYDPLLQDALSVKDNNLTQGSFSDALAQVSCVIGTSSSVLLQSMAHNKPTATMIYRDSPLFYQTGWLLGNLESYDDTLQSMLSLDSTRMEFQRYSLKQNLSQTDFYKVLDDISKLKSEPAAPKEDPDCVRFERSVLLSLLESRHNINISYLWYKIKRLWTRGRSKNKCG
jgi:hypothetical protein